MARIIVYLCIALMVLVGLAAPAHASVLPAIEQSTTTLAFPQSITFSATISAASDLQEITLEYGVEQRTCGLVTALAFPEFEPAPQATVSWTWDMRRSGSLPPGATLWYRWRAKDADGVEVVSDTQQVVWIDDQHAWKTINKGRLNLHWYLGNQAFARDLLNSASASLTQLGTTSGVVLDRDVHLYIYASSDEMREAILYEPSWTGGQAYPDYNLTIIGIAPEDIAWGKRTAAHELTHVLVGNRAFSCIGSIPTWLNEGIAVYGEGGPEARAIEQFNAALENDTLLSVRSLSGGFSEDPQQADLSYSQSYSIVQFLISEYGQKKLLQVFDRLATGDAIEPVLRDVYQFGLDGLEDRWRDSIGAKPRQNVGVEPTPTLQPSPVPTIQLATQPEAQASVPTTSIPLPTAVPAPVPVTSPADPPPIDRTSAVLIALVVGILLSIGIMLGLLMLFTGKRGR